MEMFAGIVVVGMTVPATFPRGSSLVLLRVVDAEVLGLEPADPKICTCDPAREVPEVVVGDDSVWRTRGACLDVVEASTSGKVHGNPVENLRIDGTGMGRVV